MKRALIVLIVLLGIQCFSCLRLSAEAGKFELKTTEATLTIDQGGGLKVVQNKGQIVQINASINSLWKITLRNNLNNKEYQFTPDKNVTIEKSENVFRLIVSKFSAENKILPAKAEFTISVKDDAFSFSGSLKSDSDEWIFKELNYPNLTGIQVKNDNTGIYWPEGLGMYYDNPKQFGNKSITYPSAMGAAMPWISVNTLGAGLYIGSHDPLQETKVINLSYIESAKALEASINAPIYGTEYLIPDIMIKSYAGEWYKASKFYRSWYDKYFTTATPPEWAISDSGWLLAILKQQNLDVLWPYTDIDKLCDVADQLNINMIGLFGWAVGGHDHLYPNYQPDNLMGGREVLKKAIERAHKRGIKIIVYANGKIMDTSTDYYLYNGIETIIIQDNKQPDVQFYVKQKNATPVIFAQACTGSELWRKTMYDLGSQAVSLGADGILYDQLGVLPPVLCFSKNHDHQPGKGDSKYRLHMISEIRKDMKEINPDFIVMTEATDDVVLREIDYTHGWGIGTAPLPNVFPELYRYTFPELLTTQRNPNPMITRTDANYAAVYGLRHEVETRYPGDVDYLLNGTLPTADTYSNVVSPPDVNKMNLVPAAEATKYVHSLIEFEKNNSNFFRHGKFIDQDGIKIKGKNIVVKGFLNRNSIGVVVWNKSDEKTNGFSISVSGYELKKASGPGQEKTDAFSPLDANSIRLLIFEKTGI